MSTSMDILQISSALIHFVSVIQKKSIYNVFRHLGIWCQPQIFIGQSALSQWCQYHAGCLYFPWTISWNPNLSWVNLPAQVVFNLPRWGNEPIAATWECYPCASTTSICVTWLLYYSCSDTVYLFSILFSLCFSLYI